MQNTSTTAGSTINFGQSNRAVLGTCDLYFVMETSSDNPMIYKLESAAFNEASIDFEVDGIATINWSGFAKQVKDLVSSDDSAAAGEKAYVVNAPNTVNPGTSATPQRLLLLHRLSQALEIHLRTMDLLYLTKASKMAFRLVTGTAALMQFKQLIRQ